MHSKCPWWYSPWVLEVDEIKRVRFAGHPGEGDGTLSWKTPWTEAPGGPQSMGSRRARHSWAHTHTHTHCQASALTSRALREEQGGPKAKTLPANTPDPITALRLLPLLSPVVPFTMNWSYPELGLALPQSLRFGSSWNSAQYSASSQGSGPRPDLPWQKAEGRWGMPA